MLRHELNTNEFAITCNLNSLYKVGSLKVPERYEKCFWVSSSVKGKPLPAPPSGREWATS
jgi:hypothetical protein